MKDTYQINLNTVASRMEAIKNCQSSGNTEWEEKHREVLEEELKNLPSGSGLNDGINFLEKESTRTKLIFSFLYQHLNENGYYDGWTQHKLTVTPTFGGYDMKITGRDRNGVKDYLYDLFSETFKI
jgi:hypothetical protein